MRRKTCLKNIFPYCFAALFALTLTYTAGTHADEARQYQQTLEKLSQDIPDLEKSDTGETAREIALIRSWIGQAQAFVANEKFKKIDPLLARIEAMVKFIKVRQNRVKIETAIKNAEDALAKLNQSIAQTKTEADAMLEEIKRYEKNQ